MRRQLRAWTTSSSSRSYAPAQERPDGSPLEPGQVAVAGQETGNEPVNSTSSASAGFVRGWSPDQPRHQRSSPAPALVAVAGQETGNEPV